jgi:hypothetical protein
MSSIPNIVHSFKIVSYQFGHPKRAKSEVAFNELGCALEARRDHLIFILQRKKYHFATDFLPSSCHAV